MISSTKEATDRFRIRQARPNEAARIREIEDEAGSLFAGLGLIDDELDEAFPLDEVDRLISVGQVWVCTIPDDLPVGMIIVSAWADEIYVEEMDVIPTHGGRGIGTRLLSHVCTWGRQMGFRTAMLSTFAEVEWNAPFYRRNGFEVVDPDQWTPRMHSIRNRERSHGLAVDRRVFMRKVLF